MNNINVIHIILVCLSLFLCFLTYRIGYGSAESKLRSEIRSREENLINSERQLYQREQLLIESEIALQSDIKQFEEERLRRIDDRVQELLGKKHNELQLDFDCKREELRGKYRTARDKLRTDYAEKEKSLLDAKKLEREDLRERYRTERDKLQSDYTEKEHLLLDAKKQAGIAEEQFRNEHEKWKKRNRDEAKQPQSSEMLSPEQMAAFQQRTSRAKAHARPAHHPPDKPHRLRQLGQHIVELIDASGNALPHRRLRLRRLNKRRRLHHPTLPTPPRDRHQMAVVKLGGAACLSFFSFFQPRAECGQRRSLKR